MKSSSDFIWHLIRSLTPGEKLFFRRNFASVKDGLYLKLFAAIAAQKKYNEAALLRKFAPALTKKNIASQKHYLQKKVCEALVAHDSRDNATHDIYTRIQLIRVYRKKGLLDEAHDVWKKAVTQARATESFALLNLLKTEFEKMILSSSTHTRYDELHSLFKGHIITYAQYADMITLRDIYAETVLLKRKTHFDPNKARQKKLTGLLEQVEACNQPAYAQSFWFRHYYLSSKATLLYLLNRGEAAADLLKELFGHWKKHTDFIITNGEHFIELLYMINYVYILRKEYAYVEQVFNDPINLLIKDPLQRANFEANKYLALNKVFNKTARYAEVEQLVKYMKARYQQWEPMLNSDMNQTVNLSLGIGSLVMEKYDDALYFTRRALQYFKDGTREELASVAQLLLLLIAYHLNNDRLFDAQYRNTYTYFYRRKKKHPFEAAFLQCLHRNFYEADSRVRQQEYERALGVFEKNKQDQVQEMTINIFNFPAWLMSRVQRMSYRHYVEKQLKNKNSSADFMV